MQIMFMKNLIVKISFISAIIFASFILANAQTSEKYTYRDLLNQQKVEREELKQTQKEILDKIIARQKEEVEPHKSRATFDSDYDLMIEKQRTEREEIIKLHTGEREKLMQIQADERKNFKPL
jgi:chlorite dismutase